MLIILKNITVKDIGCHDEMSISITAKSKEFSANEKPYFKASNAAMITAQKRSFLLFQKARFLFQNYRQALLEYARAHQLWA